jgi:uncharacterized membrane protein YgdD (TMEM256/DUF423 family)
MPPHAVADPNGTDAAWVRRTVVAAALLGASGVAAGAFGAHALRERLEAPLLAVYETAARYQLLHALALLGAGWVAQRWPGRAARLAIVLLLVGVLLFSGSLYGLALSGEHRLGALTPLGGLCLLGGWLALACAPLRTRRGAGPPDP